MESKTTSTQAQLGLLPCCVGWVNRQAVRETLANINVKEMQALRSKGGRGASSNMNKSTESSTLAKEYQSNLGIKGRTSFNRAKNLEAPALFSAINLAQKIVSPIGAPRISKLNALHFFISDGNG